MTTNNTMQIAPDIITVDSVNWTLLRMNQLRRSNATEPHKDRWRGLWVNEAFNMFGNKRQFLIPSGERYDAALKLIALRPALVELSDMFYKIHGQGENQEIRYEYAQYAMTLGLLDSVLNYLFFHGSIEIAKTILSQDITDAKVWANTNYVTKSNDDWPRLRVQCYEMGNDPEAVMWKAFYNGEVTK